MKKKVLSLALCLSLVITLFCGVSFSANAEADTSGTTGECTWKLEGTTLTVSGNGEMEDYYDDFNVSDDAYDTAPWGKGITTVIIEDGVTRISRCAFYGCNNLENITIPNSVTGIGRYAFYNTKYYNDSDNWDNGVLYIGNCLVDVNEDNCPKIYSIKDGTKIISDYAFGCFDSLEQITIPNTVTSIGNNAFSGCNSLNYLIIPDSVTNIEASAFYDCNGLESVVISNSITSINDYVFSYCYHLTYIAIPNGVTSIGYGAFSECYFLEIVNIPSSVTTIDKDAFENSKKVKIYGDVRI